jgi:cytochrome c553
MKLLWSLFLITVFCSYCAATSASATSAAADSPGAVMPPDDIATRVLACTGCHGKEGRAASDGFYPRIAGKPAGYLYNQLLNFRDGRRRYPVMSYLVQHLSNPYLQEIADHFAAQHPPHLTPAPVRVSAAVLERGRVLVRQGDAAKQVPACVACHGAELGGVAPAVPGLLGLSREYLSSQFGAWRNGVRHASAPDCMALVAQRLALEDVEAVSAWLSAQVVPPMLRPATHSEKFPLPCGSAGAAQ